jgi:hypothetical protein
MSLTASQLKLSRLWMKSWLAQALFILSLVKTLGGTGLLLWVG